LRLHNSIPIINIESFLTNNQQGKAKVAAEISDACQHLGFFYIENHGVSHNLLSQIESQMHCFFNLPVKEKLKLHISKSSNHRGYFPVGEENALGNPNKDIKEGFDMALDLPPNDPDVVAGKPFHGQNVWPSNLPNFRPTMEEYYNALRGLAELLCSAFAIGLNLPEDFFSDKTNKPLAQLRLLHYLPQETPKAGEAIGCGTHTDYGIVTILWQDMVGGLQIKNRKNQWINAPISPDIFICNIGEMMARWTNDLWVATPHRVINTSGKHRYSVAMFFDPNYDCEIYPLDIFHRSDKPNKYSPITMGEFLKIGFDQTFQYRK
jgi:isopenicillin N synthase-like dioxygenase